ncbi:FtsK/SpoIIIE domain-containing protein, partial [Streptococcus cameli]
SRDHDIAKIFISNSSLFESRLKKFEELLEAGLPVNMLISSFERNASAKRYEVELFDSLKTRGEAHSDVFSYDRRVGKIPAGGYELQIGRYHVDMRKTPHMLIGGASGSGKTNLLNQLILQALWGGADLHIVDVKLELSSLAESIPFYSSYDEVMELLDRLTETIETRVSYMANNRIDDCSALYSAVYLFFDELASFSLSCKSPKELKEFQNKIAKIILLGRKAGVFVVISGQYHTSETSLSVASRESLAIKVALGRANRTALEGLGFNVSDFDLRNRAFAKGEGYIYGMENQSRPALLQLDYLAFDMPEAVKISKKI